MLPAAYYMAVERGFSVNQTPSGGSLVRKVRALWVVERLRGSHFQTADPNWKSFNDPITNNPARETIPDLS